MVSVSEWRIDANLFRLVFFVLILLALSASFGYLAGHRNQHVTVCHTSTQTHCLWVDGNAYWK